MSQVREATNQRRKSLTEEELLRKAQTETGPLDRTGGYDAARNLLRSINAIHKFGPRKSPWYTDISTAEKLGITIRLCLKTIASWINILASLSVLITRKSGKNLGLDFCSEKKDIFDIEVYEPFVAIWPFEDVDDAGKALYRHRLDAIGKSLSIDPVTKEDILFKELREICSMDRTERIKIWLEVVNYKKCKEMVEKMCQLIQISILAGNQAAYNIIECTDDFFITSIMDASQLGTSYIHFCIMETNCKLLNLILSRVNEDKKYEMVNRKTHSHISHAAHVELPLSMAIWMGNFSAVRKLIASGAEMTNQERGGFGVIHHLVMLEIHAPDLVEDMFNCLMECLDTWIEKTRAMALLRSMEREDALLYAKWLLIRSCNDDYLTPLQLSAKHGALRLFRILMHTKKVYRFPYLTLGPFTEHFYDISEIDPFLMSMNPGPSVIEILSLASTKTNLAFFDETPIFHINQQLLTYSQRAGFFSGAIHLLFMVSLSVLLYSQSCPVGHGLTHFDYLLLAYTSWYFLVTTMTVGVICFLTWRIEKSFRLCISNLDILNCYLFITFTLFALTYLVGVFAAQNWYSGCMAGLLLSGWCLMVTFFRSLKPLGFFTIMLSQMLHGEAKVYTVIMVMLSVAFAISIRPFMLSQSGTDGTPALEEAQNGTHLFASNSMSFFRLGMGISDFTSFYAASWTPGNESLLFIYLLFVLLANLTILNMLIAAMSESYSQMSEERDLHLKRMLSADTIVLHALLPNFIRKMMTCVQIHKVLRFTLPDGTKAEKHAYLCASPEVLMDS